jgi:hypothetical protein
MPPTLKFLDFWDSFYDEPENDFRKFAAMLFRDRSEIEEIYVYSVFPKGLPSRPIATKGRLNIAWSGELYVDDPEKYDLNLIMRPTNVQKRIVCCPLFIVALYARGLWPILTIPRPLSYSVATKPEFCAFVVSNPHGQVRNRFFDRLSQYKKVTSCGGAMNNCADGFRAPRDPKEFRSFLSKFKFVLCFENAASPEYLTEKLHQAWLGCTVPVYWGARRALEWLNPKAFLYLPEAAMDADMDALIDRIKGLDQDEQAYAAVFAEPLLRPGGLPHAWTLEGLRTVLN